MRRVCARASRATPRTTTPRTTTTTTTTTPSRAHAPPDAGPSRASHCARRIGRCGGRAPKSATWQPPIIGTHGPIMTQDKENKKNPSWCSMYTSSGVHRSRIFHTARRRNAAYARALGVVDACSWLTSARVCACRGGSRCDAVRGGDLHGFAIGLASHGCVRRFD